MRLQVVALALATFGVASGQGNAVRTCGRTLSQLFWTTDYWGWTDLKNPRFRSGQFVTNRQPYWAHDRRTNTGSAMSKSHNDDLLLDVHSTSQRRIDIDVVRVVPACTGLACRGRRPFDDFDEYVNRELSSDQVYDQLIFPSYENMVVLVQPGNVMCEPYDVYDTPRVEALSATMVGMFFKCPRTITAATMIEVLPRHDSKKFRTIVEEVVAYKGTDMLPCKCVCTNGCPVTDIACDRNGQEKCEKCDEDYDNVGGRCVNVARPTCHNTAWLSGDTHAVTFDGYRYDNQGWCQYSETRTFCNNNYNLYMADSTKIPYFNIISDLWGNDEKVLTSPGGWGQFHNTADAAVSYVFGAIVYYKPASKKGNNPQKTYKFQINGRRGLHNNKWTLSLCLNDNTIGGQSMNPSCEFRGAVFNRNYQHLEVAVRGQRLYLGVGFYNNGNQANGKSVWDHANTNIGSDYVALVDYSKHCRVLRISLSCDLKTKVCGAMGNYDGNKHNDLDPPAAGGAEAWWRRNFAHVKKHIYRPSLTERLNDPFKPCNRLDAMGNHRPSSTHCLSGNGPCRKKRSIELSQNSNKTDHSHDVSADEFKQALAKDLEVLGLMTETCPGLKEYQNHCSIIFNKKFSGCNLNVTKAYEDCVHDACYTIDHEAAICHNLGAFVHRCNGQGKHGEQISHWRHMANCPISCPENQEYRHCEKPSCVDHEDYCTRNRTEVQKCRKEHAHQCVEGCFCKSGFLESANHTCVPWHECKEENWVAPEDPHYPLYHNPQSDVMVINDNSTGHHACDPDNRPVPDVIAKDGTIRYFENEQLCASFDKIEIKAKMWWKDCASGAHNKYYFEKDTNGGDWGYIKTKHTFDGQPLCWSILNPDRAWKQNVLLKRCKNQTRQRWILKDGMIWLATGEPKYCVPFVADQKLRTRRCFRGQLGGHSEARHSE